MSWAGLRAAAGGGDGIDMGSQRKRRSTGFRAAVGLLAMLAVVWLLIALPFRLRRPYDHTQLARTKLQGLQVAIEHYRAELGVYPPDTGPGDADGDGFDPCSLYRYLCGKNEEGIRFRGRIHGPYLKDLPGGELRDCSPPADAMVLLDPWGNPWVYEENASHAKEGSPGPRQWRNPLGFDIYSCGPDGKKDPLHDLCDNDGDGRADERDELVDDVTRWAPTVR